MTAFEEYTDTYGFHFNKKLYEWAVSMMRDRNDAKAQPMEKDKVNEVLKANGVTLVNDKGHDAAYVMMMAKMDYFGSSIMDDNHIAKYVKDYLDDKDGYSTRAFDEFVMKCRRKDTPIFWDEMQ